MVEINLLPWKDKRKQYQEKRIKQFIGGSMLVSLLLICFLHWVMTIQIKRLNDKKTTLEEAILPLADIKNKWEEDNRKNELIFQWKQTLFQYQSITEKMMMELVRPPMKHLCFNRISREKSQMTFTGFAHSVADLTEFLSHWSGNNYFSEIKITKLHLQPAYHFISFRLEAQEKEILPFNVSTMEK